VAQPSQKSEAKLFEKRNETHLLKKAKTNCLKKETKPKKCKWLSLKKTKPNCFQKETKPKKYKGSAFIKK
jgi:hypothetical protein